MPENSIWKLHLISFLAFKQPSIVSAFWWFSSNFVWYLYDYLKKVVLCFKAVRTFRAEQRLNEAFMSSCLPKTKWWVPAGWVRVKAVEAVVHLPSALCLECQKHQQFCLVVRTDPVLHSSVGWIEIRQTCTKGLVSKAHGLTYCFYFLGLSHTCVKISWRSLPKSLAAADLICGLLLLTVYWGSKARLHLQ